MPTNEERRAEAKRKLEEQLEHRARQDRRNRLLTIVGAVVAVLVVVGAVTATVLLTRDNSETTTTAESSSAAPDAPGAPGQLPAFTAPANLGHCEYPPSPSPASKPVEPPKTDNGKVPTDPATVSVSMMTDQGPVGLLLNNGQSPCTVNSFVSLAEKKYFDNTGCHRLTTAAALHVLQCGDPAGDGTGGPGYQFANEYPTDQYPAGDPALQEPVTYPRGTLAMANAGPGTNGSQFFLVYQDSQLPPGYTVFGKIQDDGLATVEKVAKAGVEGGGDDGPPATKVTITSVRVDM